MNKSTDAPQSLQQEPDQRPALPAGKQPALLPEGKPAATQRPRRRWGLWLLAAALVILFLYLLLHAGGSNTPAGKGQGESKKTAGAAITVGQSKSGDMNIYVDALGTVTPIYTVTLYSQITGQVTEVDYREGQMVNKGDALIEIDPRPYQSMLTQAEGNLEHDQGLLEEAQMDLTRYQAAWARNAIPRQTLEDQEKIVIQDEGTVKADQGTVDYDKVQLSYCHIVSPITGRVGLRLVDPGNTVFSGNSSTLVVITQIQPITVVFNVSEDDLPEVQAQLTGGRSLRVDAFDRANEKLIESGRLTSLDNEVDTTTGTIKFRAEFANRKQELFPNQFVNARLLVRTLRNVILVPSAAVQHNGDQAFVYVVGGNDTVSVQNITVLSSDDQNSAVQGLNAGVTVATSGFDRLENGVTVTIRGQPAPNKNGQGSHTTPGGGSK